MQQLNVILVELSFKVSQLHDVFHIFYFYILHRMEILKLWEHTNHQELRELTITGLQIAAKNVIATGGPSLLKACLL